MKEDLRIIFIGTPDFAVESLYALMGAGKNVVAAITAPDRKAGRGQKINESAVKKYAVTNGISVLQPTNLKNEDFISELKSYHADLQIVVAFRMLPEVVWNMPKLGTFNLHASLLPNYRGAAPINWAIINGEKETGVTTFFLKHKIDTGDLIFQEKVTLSIDETAGSLHDKLMKIGSELVVKTVNKIENAQVVTIPQPNIESKDAPKIFKDDCKINWSETANKIDRLVRGMSPFPTAWSTLNNNENNITVKVNIFIVEPLHVKSLPPGKLKVEEKEITVGTIDFDLKLVDIQIEGKKRMPVKDLLNGFNFETYSFMV
ncbi:methionyl-tRNA formyltransferase [Vicingaceae bacterium]|nr:methionyl-tRNA formyltransferase [Vicingaceae bacterium]MDC1451743.1 methionyl-tRNA formyltransferase [Vicingaceae bacterium]